MSQPSPSPSATTSSISFSVRLNSSPLLACKRQVNKQSKQSTINNHALNTCTGCLRITVTVTYQCSFYQTFSFHFPHVTSQLIFEQKQIAKKAKNSNHHLSNILKKVAKLKLISLNLLRLFNYECIRNYVS